MDEELRRRQRRAQAEGDAASAARLEAADRRGRVLPRWNPLTRVQCALAFECPKSWEEFAPTEQLDQRFCDHCERTVHEVRDAEEFRAHAEAGRCVSVPKWADVEVIALPGRPPQALQSHPVAVERFRTDGPAVVVHRFLWGRFLFLLLILGSAAYYAGARLGYWPLELPW